MLNRKLLLKGIVAVLAATIFLPGCAPKAVPTVAANRPRIGIAWRADTDSEFLVNVQRVICAAGGEPVLLPQVRSLDLPYAGDALDASVIAADDYLAQPAAELVKNGGCRRSNAADALGDLKAVVFTGGEDCSPTLYARPVPWHRIAEEKDYNATRDVSDYLLIDYCLSRPEVALLGICRGCQMLGVVSGASIVQDIPAYCQARGLDYDHRHRNVKASPEAYRDYASHSLSVAPDSILSAIVGAEVLDGCPSWHHQMLDSVDGTPLRITGATEANGLRVIETIERVDHPFAVGIQFHPEAAVCKRFDGAANADDFMSLESGLAFFKALIHAGCDLFL